MEQNRPIQEQEYQQALEGYARELNARANVRAENKENAKMYNDIISGVAEPVGTALIHPVAKNLFDNQVKPALKKALGRTVRGVGRTVRQAGQDLRDGVNPLENIRANVRSGLDEVRGAVRNVADNLDEALGGNGRDLVNGARQLAGKRPLSSLRIPSDNLQGGSQTIDDDTFEPTTTREIDEPFPEPVSPTQFGGVSERPNLETIQEDPAEDPPIKDIASDPDRWNQWVNDNAPSISREGPEHVEEIRNEVLRNPNISDDLPQSEVVRQFKEYGSVSQPQPAPTETTLVNQPTDTPTPTGSAQEVQPPPPTEEEAPQETLSTELATDATEAEVAGGGPEDILGDIISGVLGLGSIIAGAVSPVKAKSYDPIMTNPSVQYGI